VPDQEKPDFAAANTARERRVIGAIINFDWGNYRLHEVDELARIVLEDIEEDGESDRMDWARDLAKVVMVAARPVTLEEVTGMEKS
jgi:hypothetical protein